MVKAKLKLLSFYLGKKYSVYEIKKKKIKDNELFDYAVASICPKCGKDLIEIDECYFWIYDPHDVGGNGYCYFDCTCGFHHITQDGKSIDEIRDIVKSKQEKKEIIYKKTNFETIKEILFWLMGK